VAIKVLLADDHKIVRAGLRSLLESGGQFDVVAEAENGRETVSLTKKLNPDVVVMDVAMPDMNGVDATQKIARRPRKLPGRIRAPGYWRYPDIPTDYLLPVCSKPEPKDIC